MTWLISLLLLVAVICTAIAALAHVIAHDFADVPDQTFARRAAVLLQVAFVTWAVTIVSAVVLWSGK